jgi:hypothetical protein
MDIARARGWFRTAAFTSTRWLASERCFYVVLACFVLQALWFALSSRYPMAFDESFHFGLIQHHAGQWLPFFTHQPALSESYGAVVRDPSYLYHFVMSLPYRAIRLITANTVAQIIVLRLLNIALFVYGLILFRRLLLLLGSSRAMAHTILLLFSLTPVVPFLAAQINYDNLLIPLMLWCLLATFSWLESARHGRISAGRTLLLISIMLLTCLVKYVFLPIMAILVFIILLKVGHHRLAWKEFGRKFLQSFKSLGLVGQIGILLLFLVSLGLFSERYAINMWRYHSPSPACSQILSLDECLEYGPWQRDYFYVQARPSSFKLDYRYYSHIWLYWMWRRCFFAISYLNENILPLPLPDRTAAVLAIAGTGMFLGYGWRLLRKQPYRQYVLIIIVVYTVALFAETLRAYARTAQPVAINGRYLIPFMPFMMLFAGLSFREFLRKYQIIKPLAVVIVLTLFLQGGGVLTFIVQSDQHWDWQNRAVIKVNDTARYLLQPLIYGSRRRQG